MNPEFFAEYSQKIKRFLKAEAYPEKRTIHDLNGLIEITLNDLKSITTTPEYLRKILMKRAERPLFAMWLVRNVAYFQHIPMGRLIAAINSVIPVFARLESGTVTINGEPEEDTEFLEDKYFKQMEERSKEITLEDYVYFVLDYGELALSFEPKDFLENHARLSAHKQLRKLNLPAYNVHVTLEIRIMPVAHYMAERDMAPYDLILKYNDSHDKFSYDFSSSFAQSKKQVKRGVYFDIKKRFRVRDYEGVTTYIRFEPESVWCGHIAKVIEKGEMDEGIPGNHHQE